MSVRLLRAQKARVPLLRDAVNALPRGVSGPLLDRFDLHVWLPTVQVRALRSLPIGESSEVVRERANAARARQRERMQLRTRTPQLDELAAELEPDALRFLHRTLAQLELSLRAYGKVLKVSRTISDLDGSDAVRIPLVAEAVQYRVLDRWDQELSSATAGGAAVTPRRTRTMSVIKEKLKAAQSAMTAIQKQFGPGSIMKLGERVAEQVPVIPTGSPSLDKALGVGGYPLGRVVEIFGPESSGKTTLTLHAIAEAQRAGGVCAFIDAEHALDVHYAKALGVDIDQLLVSQPDTGEQALDILETLVRSGAFDLVVVDSVAALVPKAEIEGDMGDQHMGLQARLMSQALRKLTGVTHRTDTTIFFINQLRMKIGVMFGSPETTTGGHALKDYASVRLDIRRIGPVKVCDEVVGNRTKIRWLNKLAPPFAHHEVDIRYGHCNRCGWRHHRYGVWRAVCSRSAALLRDGLQPWPRAAMRCA